MQSAQPRLNSRRQKLARQYARQARRLSLAQSAIVTVIFLGLIFGGLSVKLSRILAVPQPWASALYFVILMVGLGIILVPLSYYQGFILPHRYGLSHQKLQGWLVDRAKASALSFVLGLAIVILIYWLLANFPGSWWLWTAVSLLLLSLLLSRLASTLLLSMFFKLEPLADDKLNNRLTNLAQRARTSIIGVFTINLSNKSTTANAMLAGWGRTRRIVLTDTLLQKYTTDEIEVVLAHELGHHLHRDIPKLMAIQAGTIFIGLYLSDLVLKAGVIPLGLQGPADPAGLPLLFLFIGALMIAVTPLTNAYSRRVELQADKAALDLTANPQAFIAAMTRLTNQNLSIANPDRWVELLFYDHPPYTKRVKLARLYNKALVEIS